MFLKYNVFGMLWALFILALTAAPGFAMPETVSWNLLSFDKFAHLMVFALLTLLLIIGFKKQYTFINFKNNAVLLALIISAVYGILIEIAQSLIPGRSIEFADLIADFGGAFAGWGIFYLVYKL